MAFFPCIYFCQANKVQFLYSNSPYKHLSLREKTEKIIKRSSERAIFYALATKLACVVIERGLRMIIENPYNEQSYMVNSFLFPPTVIDKDRTIRGDVFVKPTAYWFIGCECTQLCTWQKNKIIKKINNVKGGREQGLCSEERSMIHPDYARNFICDFILGKPQPEIFPTLF